MTGWPLAGILPAMEQTIKLNGWDYPVRFVERHGQITAVVGNDPITRTYHKVGENSWACYYDSAPTYLPSEEATALTALFVARPKPTLEERVEALEKRSGYAGLDRPIPPSYPPSWGSPYYRGRP